jgi:hypothetical protein
MSKAKEVIDDIRNKVFERKKQETIEEAKKTIEASLTSVAYAVTQDPDSISRQFVIAKIVYDLTKKLEDGTYPASVVEVRPFDDKGAAMTMIKDTETRKFFFEKNKGKK